MSKVNCIRCIHFFSTYDPQMPRGCRKFNIKSKTMPHILVEKESNHECRGFKEREHLNNHKTDLNDDKLW